MAFVIDASTVVCWIIEDEDHPAASEAMIRAAEEDLLVPPIWWFEVRNALLMSERRPRVDRMAITHFLRELSAMPIIVDTHADEDRLLSIARRHVLTVYDAAYLELASRMSLRLCTLDGPLARAARAEGVSLLGDHD